MEESLIDILMIHNVRLNPSCYDGAGQWYFYGSSINFTHLRTNAHDLGPPSMFMYLEDAEVHLCIHALEQAE